MVVAGNNDDIDAALVHGWAYYLALRDDPTAEAEALSNIGNLLALAGESRAALGAFRCVLDRHPSDRIALAAAGGAAMASARMKDTEGVRRLAAYVRIRAAATPFAYASALALFECAGALRGIGDVESAKAMNVEAQAVAERNGFHEVDLRAEAQARELDAAEKTASKASSPAALSVIRRLETAADGNTALLAAISD
jgi:hypothetical protein